MLWLCDKLSRGIQAARLIVPSSMEWNERNSVLILKLPRSTFASYRPGQYFFVNIPEITMNEWHPFTASAVLEDEIIFYIKRLRANSNAFKRQPWTGRLADLVASSPMYPAIRLSGPFGHTDFESYETVLLFAGGIGITPMIASFTTFMREAIAKKANLRIKTVVLVWMSPATVDFKMFRDIFALAAGSADALREKGGSITTDSCSFYIRLHCTKKESWAALTDPFSVDYVRLFVSEGRCDLQEVFTTFQANGHNTIAAACGPSSLSRAVSRQAARHGTDFHAEQFAF